MRAIAERSLDGQHLSKEQIYAAVSDGWKLMLLHRWGSSEHTTLQLVDDENKPHGRFLYDENRRLVTGSALPDFPTRLGFSKMAEFVSTFGVTFSVDLRNLGFLIDEGGAIHDLAALPENLRIRGDLVIPWDLELFNLPDGMKVEGELMVGKSLRSLPKNLDVGRLNLFWNDGRLLNTASNLTIRRNQIGLRDASHFDPSWLERGIVKQNTIIYADGTTFTARELSNRNTGYTAEEKPSMAVA